MYPDKELASCDTPSLEASRHVSHDMIIAIIDLDEARSVTLKKSFINDIAGFVNLLLTLVKCVMYYQRSMGYEVMTSIRRLLVVRVFKKGRRGITVF